MSFLISVWLGRNGNPLQYSCMENPMDGEAWWATVHILQGDTGICGEGLYWRKAGGAVGENLSAT